MNPDYSRKWMALVGLGLLSFTAFLDFTIVTTALPFIQTDLNASVLQLQWIMTIFAMMMCMFMIIVGKAGDRLGQTRVFYFGFLLFGIAAIGAGSSQTIQWLIFFRGIQGFAAAIIATVGVSLLPQTFPPEEQTHAIGIFSAFNGAGLAIGPFLGGSLISLLGWRWVFWINIPIIVVGLVLCFLSLKPSPKLKNQESLDWAGLILLIIGLGTLIYGIVRIEQVSFDYLTKVYLGTGALSLIILFCVERRVKDPLLDLSIFKNKLVLLAMLVCMSAGIITYVFMFFDPLYLAVIRKQSAFIVGLTLLCVPLIQVLISILLEKLVRVFGIFNLLLFGLIAGVIAAICHVFFTPTMHIGFVLLTLTLMGYTWGIANAGTIVAGASSIKPERLGAAMGTIFTFWNVSGSIFLSLSTVLFHWQEHRFMHATLTAQGLKVSAEQHQQIFLMLSDPSQMRTVLQAFSIDNAMIIYEAFYRSFMSGFHLVAVSAAALLSLFFLIGLKLR